MQKIKFIPHSYQLTAIDHSLRNTSAGLILDMGLGKTIITWTVLRLLVKTGDIDRPLIIAPKRVTEHTWLAELEKWEHLKGMTISRIIGTPKQRIAALSVKADVYAVSRDNIVWLVEYLGKKWNFDMLVIDEWSSFKNRASQRFKALKSVLGYFERVIGLTGTPAPNGLLDLWSQIYLLDKGERLGKTITGYRDLYFNAGDRNGSIVYNFKLKEGAKEAIYEKIGDICISMRAKDWLDLPERIDIIQEVELTNWGMYREFVKKEYLKLSDQTLEEAFADGMIITPVNAAVLRGKLLQFCNGAVYDETGNYHIVSNDKLEALQEEIEALNGQPVIVFYQFRSDAERIQKAIKGVTKLKGADHIDSWNRGEIQVLLAHAAGAGHGLNLQDGGHHILWFGIPDSLELYQQAVARLHRQGQKSAVINKILTTKGTAELKVWLTMQDKDATQEDLILALLA